MRPATRLRRASGPQGVVTLWRSKDVELQHKHRAIKVNDLGDEIEGLLSDSTDADLLAPTPEPSLKLRKKKKRKEHSPYWIAQDAQHRFRCDVVRLDAWKQGTARDMKIGN